MGAHHRNILPSWSGFLLVVVGFLLLAGSFFLLPLYVTTLNCFDSCTPPKYATAWQLSLNLLSHLSVTPLANLGILVLLWLPLLAPVAAAVCSICLLARPRRRLVTWIRVSRLAGSIALVVTLPFLLFYSRPDIGYFGMLLAYALLWAGSRLLVEARP